MMAVQRFGFESLPAVPWKNGGGVTREIVCRPAGAAIGDFDWRVSIAAIVANGPFSAFPGIDRVITLLDGGGVRLRSRDGAIDHRLDTPLAPFAFAGELAIDAELLGDCRDLNVMTRRSACRARVQVARADGELPPAGAGLLFAARGAWRALNTAGDLQPLATGAGLWWDGPAMAWRLNGSDPGAALVAVLVERSR